MMPRKISVCLGYWKNDDATVVVVAADGYFRTGDAAVGNVSRGGLRERDGLSGWIPGPSCKIKGFVVS
jgi:acyl-CoA synthetase (AMP-forming)/AMP-acid ligase II